MKRAQNRTAHAAWRSWVVTLAVAFALAGFVGLSEETRWGVLPQEDGWTVVRPSVLWCGESTSTATIEAHLEARADVVGARVVGPNETFPLYDDGTHGDAKAGDLIFTAGGVYPYCHSALSLKYGDTVGSWSGTLEVTLMDGTTLLDERPIRIGLVQPRYHGKSAVIDYQNGLSATAYAFFIQDIDNTVFDGYPVARADDVAASQRALRIVYSILPDTFDLAVIMPGRTMFHALDLSELPSQSQRVTNDAEHIGIPVFNDATAYGSTGRLRGVIVHPFGSISFVDSEIASLWGADLGVPLDLTEPIAAGRFLWSPVCDVGGQLASYFILEDGSAFGHFAANGDGTWKLVSPAEIERYSPLELYAMGFVPAGDVPPVHLLSQIGFSDLEHITSASVRTVTINDVIAAQGGVRYPTPDGSQKSFTVAFVVVQEAPFTDAEYAYYSLLSYHLMSREAPEDFDQFAPFYWATGGRGTLDTRLPVDVKPILTP